MAYVVIANHPHKEDMIYVHLALRTGRLWSMGWSIQERFWFLRWWSTLSRCFPVVPGAGLDRNLKIPKRLLAEGKSVLVFPQGFSTRRRDVRTHRGALELALRTQSLILPVYIAGRFRVQVGTPFNPLPSENVMERVWAIADGVG